MSESVVNVLLAILGFLLGTGTTLLVSIVQSQRERQARLALVRSELRAFVGACEWAAKGRFWTSANVRNLATIVRDRFSVDPLRWTVVTSDEGREALSDFHLECCSLLQLMELCDQQAAVGVPVDARAIGVNTFEGCIQRAQKLLSLLPRRRWWHAG